MTKVELLQRVLQELAAKGVTPVQIAAAMGWSMPTYYSRTQNESDWKASEIVAFTVLSGISKDLRDAIFLEGNVI